MFMGRTGLLPYIPVTVPLHTTSHCTEGASWSKPLYAHGKHKNAAAPLGTEGSFGNWNKLGFAVSLAGGLTFVSTMLKEHSVSTKVFFKYPWTNPVNLCQMRAAAREGVDASYEANILVSVNAS